MFNLSEQKLKEIGAEVTTKEIAQQPELWKIVLNNYFEKEKEIKEFLEKIKNNHDKIKVIFSGAGTSAFVGETASPYLNKVHRNSQWNFESIATTDIVASPENYFDEKMPTLLVSFARSGNSPESVETVNLAEKLIENLYQITITCASEGKLAKNAESDKENLLLLQPELSNDQGFAMTGSFTCMLLTTLLVFDNKTNEKKEELVNSLVDMGKYVIKNEKEIQDIVDLDFDRVVYLGSGSLFGLAHEAQLKILELTAGDMSTMYETPVGFRHGPKSFINNNTIVFLFGSNNLHTQKYDIDLSNEVYHDKIARKMQVISASKEGISDAENFTFGESYSEIPDVYLSLPYIMFGQTFAVMSAIKIGNKADTPSPTGTVNRVVQGVLIHNYTQ